MYCYMYNVIDGCIVICIMLLMDWFSSCYEEKIENIWIDIIILIVKVL